MQGYILPLTPDPWQVMPLDLVIDGEAFHAQVELRYLPAADQWLGTSARTMYFASSTEVICLNCWDAPPSQHSR